MFQQQCILWFNVLIFNLHLHPPLVENLWTGVRADEAREPRCTSVYLISSWSVLIFSSNASAAAKLQQQKVTKKTVPSIHTLRD